MSMRFTDLRPAVNCALAAVLAAACSAPMPVPPPASPAAATEPSPPSTAAPPAQDESRKIVKDQFEQAVAFMQKGQDKEAAALFANVAKLDPDLASPHTNLGILYYREGKPKEAEAAFKKALQIDDKDYVAANYLGMLYRAQGRFNDAESAYEQALAAKPDYGYAHLNLAILYDLYLDNLPKALDHYREYQRISGDDDPKLVGWLADLQQRMKSTDEDPTP
jgi:tetratricopeptide (TPR) repeat protein